MLVKKHKKPSKKEVEAYINQITQVHKVRYETAHDITRLDVYVDESKAPLKINNVIIAYPYGGTTVYLKTGNHKIFNEIMPLYDVKEFYVVVKGEKGSIQPRK